MSSSREAQIAAQALAQPEAERAAWLDRECGGDAALKARVEALLATHEEKKTVPVAHPGETMRADSSGETSSADPLAGTVIAGRYTLVEKIGEGGMGEVWAASQTEPVKRKVALKLIRRGMDSRAVVQRFDQERQALAVMDHPNIARVLDGGLTPTGQPFFVMELVKGLPLTDYCDHTKLTPRERLELFVPVCQAIQHAHQKGIVHRDLKPANILVTTIDGRPTPKVIDFGVAKAMAGKLTDESMATMSGAVIGTLEYMAPEQAAGADIDTRADIYALGVILYELLTGLRPIDSQRLKQAALMEMLRIVREEEPAKPSTRLSTDASMPSLAALRQTEPRKLMSMLRGELDWVVMKCLEKQRSRRYETVNGVARDIERYLADEPVEARPPSAGYRITKFVRRHKAPVVATVLVLGASVAGTVVASWQAGIARQQRDRAFAAEQETKKRADELAKVSEFQAGMLKQVDATSAGAKLMADVRAKFRAALEKSGVAEADRAAREELFGAELARVNATDTAVRMIDRTILQPAVQTIDSQFGDQPLVDASLRTTLGVIYESLGRYEEALKLFQRAATLRAAKLGTDHPDTLAVRAATGNALGELQQLAEAETTVRAVLQAYTRALGEDAQATLDTKTLLAVQLHLQGKYEDSEAIRQDVLERRRRTLGPDDPQTLGTMQDLGTSLLVRGKYTDAIAILREVAAAQRRLAAPSLAATLSDLGLSLSHQKEYAAAEPLLREALELRRRELGDEHPMTATSIGNLATTLMDEDKLAEAEPLAKEALDITRRLRGNEHADTLKALNVMGKVLVNQNKFAQAEPYWREALATGRRVLGENHPDTIIWISNMGVVLSKMGRLPEAEPYYREALEKNRQQLGETHPYTFTITRNLGDLLRQMNRPGEAEGFYRTGLENFRRIEGEDHPETINLLGLVGSVLRDQGKLDEAGPYFEQSIEKCRRLNGENHATTITAILRMGSLRVAQGQFAAALSLLTPLEGKVQNAYPGTFGVLRQASYHGLLGKARAGLAKDPADFAAAEALLLEAQGVFSKNRGDKDKETKEWTQALVDFYTAWDAAEPGKGYATRSSEWKTKMAPIPGGKL